MVAQHSTPTHSRHPKGLTSMTPDWIRWLLENVATNCTTPDLIKTLVNNKFDPDFAAHAVHEVQKTHDKPDELEKLIQNLDFAYEGPGLGYHNVVHTTDRDVQVLFSLKAPEVYLFGNLFSKEECEELIALSRHKLERSTTVDPKTGKTYIEKDRTSRGTFFALNENPFIAKLDRRIADIMQLPVTNGEGIQMLNYQVGGEYKPHFDYFPPQDPGSAIHIARGGQRISTMVMYLNTVEGGGETSFPELGLEVAATQGNAVYFSYYNSRKQVDRMTLHAGKPVLKGEKWIATKWMREGTYR